MTSTSKRFSHVFSFVTAMALSLGLMVTGCSDGDDRPGHVAYDDTTKIDVIVGLADAEEAITEKGFDVPATATHYTCEFSKLDKFGINHIALRNKFTAEAGEYTKAYKELENGAILMQNTVDEAQVENIDAVFVLACDKEDNILGCFYENGLSITAGKTTIVDFTSDDAPEFMTRKQMFENSDIMVFTEPQSVEDVTTIAVGETVTATVDSFFGIGAQKQLFEVLDPKDYTMSCDSEDVSIEGNVVTGVAATEEPVEINVNITAYDTNLTTSFKVMVTGDTPVEPEYSAIYLAPEGFEVSEDGTAIINAEGEEVATDELPTEQDISVGDSMTFVVIAEKAAEEEAADGEEAAVTYEAITDVEATLETESHGITNAGLTVTIGEDVLAEDTAILQAIYSTSEESNDDEEEAETLESNTITITVAVD